MENVALCADDDKFHPQFCAVKTDSFFILMKAGQTVSCIRCALVGTEKCRGKKNKDGGEAEGEADRGVNGKERPRALTAKRQFLVDDKWQAAGTLLFDRALYRPSVSLAHVIRR
ncbi:hypothetical protein ALC60_06121 [Trachymyrmex zeteki]|uniref:Uncharacterized protein n=1 Tax=Mycetomoellerius zeteki TaxID=64791 RepID=A0A151X3L1_9HYME|nr:hypothetical protein ALC60_06121 [Trachymyrmex zeteki]